MKNPVFFLVAIATMLSFGSCSKERIRPSGNITTEERTVDIFNEIDVDHGIRIHAINDAGQPRDLITIETYDNVQQYIEAYVHNNTLTIRVDYNVILKGDHSIDVYVNPETLTRVDGAGGASIDYSGTIVTRNLYVYLRGGSRFTTDVYVTQMVSEVSGGSLLYLSGRCDNFNITSSGGSITLGYELTTNDAVFNISGGSKVKQTINNTINLVASGGSMLFYKGDAVVEKISLSGGSELIHEEGGEDQGLPI